MNNDRRIFLKQLAASSLLALTFGPRAAAQSLADNEDLTPINVIIPPDYQIPVGSAFKDYPFKLTRATLELLEKNYSTSPVPVWEKPFASIDLEKRLTNIVHWLLIAIKKHQAIYPLDPAWAIAMIMKESYFYEFAISKALAIGICQFVEPTALSYNMTLAGKKPAHHKQPFKLTEYAGEATRYFQLRSERRSYRRTRSPAKRLTLEEALAIIESGDAQAHRSEAAAQLRYEKEYHAFTGRMQEARENYRRYLLENVQGRDVFNNRDVDFLLKFDERFTYKKPLDSMVEMLARSLQTRNGNVLAATIGYNAGLSSTKADGRYKEFGMIPAIEQSTTYLSHILVNHYEIISRI